jgi:hypothetical protein
LPRRRVAPGERQGRRDGRVSLDGRDRWVDRNDFDSKYAFTVVQNLMAPAEADTSSKAPVVTIPAN